MGWGLGLASVVVGESLCRQQQQGSSKGTLLLYWWQCLMRVQWPGWQCCLIQTSPEAASIMLLHTLRALRQLAFCMGQLQASVLVSQLEQGMLLALSRLNTH
jgi:hypothetical protein